MARRAAKPRRTVKSRAAHWWGRGAAPWERWPGVSLRLEARRVGTRIESLCGRYVFRPDVADRVCDFFPLFLRHWRAEFEGQPFELLDWQRHLVIRPTFGWLRREDELRRFRKLFLGVAKKNGKTGLAAGISLYLLVADGEAGADVYAAARDIKQARLVYKDAGNMARASTDLMRVLEVGKEAIYFPARNSTYQVLSSLADSKHGLNVHGLVIDEFHAQRSRILYETLHRGTSARSQPLVVLITTAGDDRESICYEEWEGAREVRDGARDDPQLLPVLFEPDKDDDWRDPKTWAKGNPSLGVTKRVDHMETECRRAEDEPRKLNSFLQLECNVWTDARTAWITHHAWAACARGEAKTAAESRALEPDDLGDLVCCAGLDLSATTDLTCLAAVWRRPDPVGDEEAVTVQLAGEDEDPAIHLIDYTVELRLYPFIPEERLKEREKTDNQPYRQWVRDGWLHVTPGAIVDYSTIMRTLRHELVGPHHLQQVGYDPWNASQFVIAAQRLGIPMVEIRQGYASLSGPSKILEALVLSGRIRHGGSPVMRWAVGNTEVRADDNGNIRPVKPKDTRRIDPMLATIMGVGRVMAVETPRRSVYETRGIRTL